MMTYSKQRNFKFNGIEMYIGSLEFKLRACVFFSQVVMDRNTRHLIVSLLPALLQSPADASQYLDVINALLGALCALPADPLIKINHRLALYDNNVYIGRDVFTILSDQRFQFYQINGETPETFLQLVGLVGFHNIIGYDNRLSNCNRMLLMVIWLRSYLSYHVLSAVFNVSITTVHNTITSCLPIFVEKMKPFIRWPSAGEWLALRGNWRKIPLAVGSIDGTSHRIYRPKVEPQEQYYSGHRHFHAVHTQVVVDNLGNIRFVQSGF